MFLRDIGVSNCLAIIDRHVLAFMRIVGLIGDDDVRRFSAERYKDMEHELRRYADFLGYPLGILDRAIWSVMRLA